MAEFQTSSGLWVSGRKDNRITTDTIRPGITAGQIASKFRDYNAFLNAARTIPYVNACASLLAYSFASNEWDLVDDNDDPLENPDDPFLQLLARPNPNQTGFEFLEMANMHLTLTGNCYITKEQRDGDGRPRELYLANPARMRIIPGPSGVAGYAYETQGGMAIGGKPFIPYEPDEVIHIPLPHPNDDWYGLGNVEAMQRTLDIVAAMAEHELAYWSSGGRIVGVLQTESTLTDEDFDHLKREWQAANRDSAQRVRTAILEKGVNYKPVAEGLAALDLVNIDHSKRDQILAIWGVPAPKLGIMENAQYKLQDADRTFWSETMGPYYLRWEDSIQQLVDLFHEGMRWRFERKNFEDDDSKFANAQKMGQSGMFTIDEARIYAGSDPLPNGAGEILMLPPHFTPIRLDDLDKYAEEIADPAEPPPSAQPVAPTAAPKVPAPPTGGTIVHLADHVPGMKSAELAQEQADEERRERLAMAVKTAKLRSRHTLSPMERMREYGTKKIARGGGMPHKRTASQRHPAIGAAIERDRDRLLAEVVPEYLPKLRAAFRAQQSAITKSAVLSRIMKSDDRPAALREAWDGAALRHVLMPLYDQVTRAGYAQGQRVLPLKQGKSVKALPPSVLSQFPKLGDRITGIDETTQAAIADQIATGMDRGYSMLQIANGYADENYDGIQGVFNNASDYRAEMIARTETMQMYNDGSILAYTDAGVDKVEALDGDGDAVCADRDGRIYAVDNTPEDHPNGTLAWVPIIPAVSGQTDATTSEDDTSE